ncbi:helix-turn-helix transcriptional regulator [Legionella sp.]|uniref:helix-turn-helix domain-containing protein n=1 Tax=Legionella sp. TaxID=459 RepID=UPI0032202EB4
MQIYPVHPNLRLYVNSIEAHTTRSIESYRVFPSLYPALGCQYAGELAVMDSQKGIHKLKKIGMTGLLLNSRDFQALSPNTKTILVKLYPWGIPKLFRESAHTLCNASVGLSEILDETFLHSLEEKIAYSRSPDEIVHKIQDFLLKQYSLNEDFEPKRIISIANTLSRQPHLIKISEIGAHYGYSQRTLERHFLNCVGITPKKFIISARFQQALESLKTAASWTELAQNLSYYDQSHFIKEFKQLTGMTPNQFLDKETT